MHEHGAAYSNRSAFEIVLPFADRVTEAIAPLEGSKRQAPH